MLSLGGAPGFVIGENGWILEGQPVPVIRGAFVKNASDLADPIVESDHIFGPNLPTRTVGLHSAVSYRTVELSGRAEYSGGNYVQDWSREILLRLAGGPFVTTDIRT